MTAAEQTSCEFDGADDAIIQLGQSLQHAGYDFTTVTPLSHERNNARRGAALGRNLRDIFGWSRPFEEKRLAKSWLDFMRDANIVQPCGQHWRSSLRWSTLDDLLFAHSAYPTDDKSAVFFGPDSYRFARELNAFFRHHTGAINRVADIGCGTGVGAILAARALPRAAVAAVDINPTALRLCAINARLAKTYNVQTIASNLLNDLDGQFELIIANPPYLLDPQRRAYRHGGGELGAGLSFDIVQQSLERLTSCGHLLLYTGVAIVDGQDPFKRVLADTLAAQPCTWQYEEIDPDVFGEELSTTAYQHAERIAAVLLTLRRH